MCHVQGLETDRLSLQRQALKVTRVVKDLLSLAADGQHSLHCDGRVLATQRLCSQQHSICSIQHSIGHICCFCPTHQQTAVRYGLTQLWRRGESDCHWKPSRPGSILCTPYSSALIQAKQGLHLQWGMQCARLFSITCLPAVCASATHQAEMEPTWSYQANSRTAFAVLTHHS